MNQVFELLMFASLIGAVDVIYFHIYRHRLFEAPSAVAEQVTHLVRGAIFIAIVSIAAFSDGAPWARTAMLGLIVADLANGFADVLLEKRSRAPMGGLPSGEYLLHILGTFVTGLAVATFWWHASGARFEPAALTGLQVARAWFTIVVGTGMVALEGGLFARAILRRSALSTPAVESL